MPLYRTYSEGEFLLGIWKSDETTEQLLASLEHKDWYREKLAVFPKDGSMNGCRYVCC